MKCLTNKRATLPGVAARLCAISFAAAALGAAVAPALAGDYQSEILKDGPLAYYRLGDTLNRANDSVVNSGSLGAAGNGSNIGLVAHRVAGAIIGAGGAAASYGGGGARTAIPYNPALNPSGDFTIEAWVKPAVETDDNVGPAPLFNRHSPSGANRQGWVFFQRSPATGWNFRTYNENGGNTAVSITGGSNGADKWSHLVAVKSGDTVTLYVDGVSVGSSTATYAANTDAPLTIGAYGANNPGDNSFNGAADEVALYSTALSASQVLAHYQNATNAARAVSYDSLVLADGAVEYLHLDEPNPAVDVAVNSGTLGPDGDGVTYVGAAHATPGAIAGSGNASTTYRAIDPSSTDGAVPTRVPFQPGLNTAVFTVEAWLKPTIDGAGNAQCPLYNRREDSPRTGWVFFQRDHNTGWNFRCYNGVNTDRSIDITGGPYTISNWCHVVATFDGSTGVLYVNGVSVGTQSVAGSYAPNADSIIFAVGGYFDASQNPFTGSIDEVAIYTNALSAATVLSHYQNGTNASRSTPYGQLVMQDKPVEFLRLNEPIHDTATNSGTLGASATGYYSNAGDPVPGPQTPDFEGFTTNNLSRAFDGFQSQVDLGNPTGLNFSGQGSVEAWVQPNASLGGIGDILAHGANDTLNAEDYFRVSSGVYQVGSYDGSDHIATYAVPSEDYNFGAWVHLVGTYDGTNWNLFRNGMLVSTTPDATGFIPIANADWCIGTRGRWKYDTGNEERQFLGGIDEVAIYDHALSVDRVAAHYTTGAHGPSPLTIAPSGKTATLTWSSGTLQEADNVAGPYTDVAGAVSPYTPPAGPAKKFYRLSY